MDAIATDLTRHEREQSDLERQSERALDDVANGLIERADADTVDALIRACSGDARELADLICTALRGREQGDTIADVVREWLSTYMVDGSEHVERMQELADDEDVDGDPYEEAELRRRGITE